MVMFTSVKNRGLVKHFVCVLVLLALSLVLFLPSFGAAVDGRVPMFEESLPSIGVVQAYSSYLGRYGGVPQLFNTKCYSEPMDSFVYMRTPVGLLPGLLSSVFGLDAFLALVVEFVFFTFT